MNHEELHIIASILSGRTEQFAYFLDTYGPQVFHLIVRMIGSPEDAEELTQDCFMKAFTHLPRFMETAVSLPGFTALPTMKRPPHSGKKIKNCFHSTTGCGTAFQIQK